MKFKENKFKSGQKVVVKNLLTIDLDIKKEMMPSMMELGGAELTIEYQIEDKKYSVKENNFLWDEGMLERVKKVKELITGEEVTEFFQIAGGVFMRLVIFALVIGLFYALAQVAPGFVAFLVIAAVIAFAFSAFTMWKTRGK